MVKRTLSGSLVCLGMLIFAQVAASAQTQDGAITINGGSTTIYMKAPTRTVAPAIPSKLVKIYSNLGTGSNVYNPSVGGGNALVMSLNANNKDRPGKALHTWRFTNLPNFGSCCTLQIGKLTTGIPVKKGTLYWVALRPEKQFHDTFDVWNNDFSGAQGLWSNNTGSGWHKASRMQLNAFGVFGK